MTTAIPAPVTARALWTVAPRRVELREEALPEPGPGQVRVRTIFTGVSRGTERLVFEARVPEGEHALMRGPLQAGDFPFPVKYGYCAVGTIEAGPPERIGQRVFCLHPHQDVFLAPAAMCVPVPGDLPSARAVLGANMETALNILWDAAALPGERILVVGAGVVGLLTTRLAARIPGTEVTVYDPDPRKRALAEAAGAAFVDNAVAIRDTHDLVIHASGHPEGLVTALAACAFEGRILEASWFGTKPVSLPLGGAFHPKRLSIRASQVGAVAPAMRGHRSHAERLALALRLLAEDEGCDALTGGAGAAPVPFAELPARMEQLLYGSDVPPCPLVTYI